MPLSKTETFPLKTETDIVQARQMVRKWTIEIGFGLVDQTKIITAASELARNTIIYGRGGTMTLESVQNSPHTGLRPDF